MDYFNTVLKRPSMKLAGTSMPFCKCRTQAVTKAVVCAILSVDGAYKRTLAVNWKE